MAEVEQRTGLMALARFLDIYYIGNVGLLIGYGVIRLWIHEHSDFTWSKFLAGSKDMLAWEKRAFLLLASVAAIKFFRRQSLDGFLAVFFLYAKSVVMLLLFLADLRLFSYYLILFWLHMVFTRQPLYKGPSEVLLMNAHDFRKMVTGAGADPNVYWLVELYTLWHPACVALEPVLADLSLRYATPGLRFGKVDVSRYPQIAADMNVSVTGSSRQLPTLIMFKAGKELGRIPHVYEGGNVAKGVFRRKAIEKGFDLQGYSEATRNYVPKMSAGGEKESKKDK